MTRGFYRLNEDGSVDRINTIRNADGYWDEDNRDNPPLGFVWAETPAEAFEKLIPKNHAENYQVRAWMIRGGMNPDVVPQIIAQVVPEEVPEGEINRAEALMSWDYAVRVPRDFPLVNVIGAQMNLTPEQIDAAWPSILKL